MMDRKQAKSLASQGHDCSWSFVLEKRTGTSGLWQKRG